MHDRKVVGVRNDLHNRKYACTKPSFCTLYQHSLKQNESLICKITFSKIIRNKSAPTWATLVVPKGLILTKKLRWLDVFLFRRFEICKPTLS
jgi:hypothetical protein